MLSKDQACLHWPVQRHPWFVLNAAPVSLCSLILCCYWHGFPVKVSGLGHKSSLAIVLVSLLNSLTDLSIKFSPSLPRCLCAVSRKPLPGNDTQCSLATYNLLFHRVKELLTPLSCFDHDAPGYFACHSYSDTPTLDVM